MDTSTKRKKKKKEKRKPPFIDQPQKSSAPKGGRERESERARESEKEGRA
jgi:hypothetical protein